MTKLNKPIRRETDTIVRDKSKRRVLIVGLEPGDVITVRPKGTRKSYSVSVESVYMFAARIEGERIRRERKAGKAK